MANSTSVKKEAAPAVSAREILKSYLKGDVTAILTYKKICNAFELVDRQFLEQLLDISDLTDDHCKTLVSCISKLRWTAIPEDMRERWRNLLCDIGVRHVVHLETIYMCAITNLIPHLSFGEDKSSILALPQADQEELFAMAHSIIAQMQVCIPVSATLISKIVNRLFPHHTAPALKFTWYVRNVLNISEYADSIRGDLWRILIDRLVGIDTLISQPGSDSDDSGAEGIFVLDIEDDSRSQLPWEESTAEQVAKLDDAMDSVMLYLAACHGQEVDESAASWMHCTGKHSESVFIAMHGAMDSHLLPTPSVRFVSFLWMYLGSLHESYPRRILSFLYDVMIRPNAIQGETRKSHGAAAYLAAFLARAKYIDINLALAYLVKMAAYLTAFVDRVGLTQRSVVPGLPHHGVFYAIANAFFLAFAFRYKEIVKCGALEQVRLWNLGRFIHSSLDPLKYSLPSVARCFSTVSRSLQLIYCQHVIPLSYEDIRRPFEPAFPFDTYALQKTAHLIVPLTRKFSPMAEDTATISEELRAGRKMTKEEEDETSLDFLDDADDAMDFGSVKNYTPLGSGSMFSSYSTTPGLRPFTVGSPMDM